MKQPNLGKQISELRLAKGLTQGELAEKCNVSLRTIQRIESGEVMPRSYTIKLIFENLDYDIYNSFGKVSYRLDRIAYRLKIWLGQLYKYVSDLFNLKTKKMKKIATLLIPVLLIGLIIYMVVPNSHAREMKKAELAFEQLDSTYKYMEWFNSGQIDSIIARYMDDAWSMPDKSPAIHGKEAIRAHLLESYNRGLRFTKLKSTYSVVSDTIAFDRGDWTVTVNHFIVSGHYITQFRYYKGKWLEANGMSQTETIKRQD